MITQEQFEEFLALTHEISAVEFKGPGSRRDNPLFGKVVRAVMGMANRRDGGFVIIGVTDHNGVLSTIGLTGEQLATWRHDDIADGLASHADPPISFDSAVYTSDKKRFVVLQIHEYSDMPIVCKQEYKDNSNPNIPPAQRPVILRKGACYIRRRHKAETVEISSAEDMRSLLEMAIEKGLSKFITQAQRAGLSTSGSSQPNHQELFEQQLENWTSPLIEKIQTRGFWKVIIRPDNFSPERVAYDALYPLVQRSAVDLRGDSFPNVVSELPIIRGADCVGQQIEAGHFLEAWNIYQSGQFIYFSGMVDDWLDQSDWPQLREGWQLGNKLAIEEVIRLYTGIFVFASRLFLTDDYTQDTYINIDVLIKGLQGRHLYISTPRRAPLRWNYEAHIPEFRYKKKLQKDELIADAEKLALQASHDLFLHFGWNATQATLESTQSNYYIGS